MVSLLENEGLCPEAIYKQPLTSVDKVNVYCQQTALKHRGSDRNAFHTVETLINTVNKNTLNIFEANDFVFKSEDVLTSQRATDVGETIDLKTGHIYRCVLLCNGRKKRVSSVNGRLINGCSDVARRRGAMRVK